MIAFFSFFGGGEAQKTTKTACLPCTSFDKQQRLMCCAPRQALAGFTHEQSEAQTSSFASLLCCPYKFRLHQNRHAPCGCMWLSSTNCCTTLPNVAFVTQRCCSVVATLCTTMAASYFNDENIRRLKQQPRKNARDEDFWSNSEHSARYRARTLFTF